MEKLLNKKVVKLSKEAAFVLITVVCAVVLPQIFHALGVVFGIGGSLGAMFLPMYIPVLIFGFYRGPLSGAVAGLLTPVISFMITGMPSAALLPFITLELIATGFLAGVLAASKLPAIFRVLAVQVGAKLVRLSAFAISLYAASCNVSMSVLFGGILTSVPGVVLQLIVVTLLISKKEKAE